MTEDDVRRHEFALPELAEATTLGGLDPVELQRLREARAMTFSERLRRNAAAAAFLLRLRGAPRRPAGGGTAGG